MVITFKKAEVKAKKAGEKKNEGGRRAQTNELPCHWTILHKRSPTDFLTAELFSFPCVKLICAPFG